MKINGKYIIIGISIVLSVLVSLVIVVSVFDLSSLRRQKEDCQIVETVVSDKYINQGYCSLWFCYPTTFVIVSQSEDGKTWTSQVPEDYWNSIDIQDKLEICEKHGMVADFCEKNN